MEIFNVVLPIILIVAVAGLYIWFLRWHRAHRTPADPKQTTLQRLPQSAPLIPYLENISVDFFQALKQALPEKYIIYPNVPVEKLFEVSKREALNMKGQYADFVVFTPSLMPVLVVDLFDMSIVNLDRVNKIKNVSKEILRHSGLPVLDYQYTNHCNIDELRRKIATLLNPLRVDKK